MEELLINDSCVNPISYLDDECLGCKSAFHCIYTLQRKGIDHKKPVKVFIDKPSHSYVNPKCIHCDEEATLQVNHRSSWHICERCLRAYFPRQSDEDFYATIRTYGADYSKKTSKPLEEIELPTFSEETPEQMSLF